jgi:hypothetical protein
MCRGRYNRIRRHTRPERYMATRRAFPYTPAFSARVGLSFVTVLVALSNACVSARRAEDGTRIGALRAALRHDARVSARVLTHRKVGLAPHYSTRCDNEGICAGLGLPSSVLRFAADSLKWSIVKRNAKIDCQDRAGCEPLGISRMTFVDLPEMRGDTVFVPFILEQRIIRDGVGKTLRNGYTYVVVTTGGTFDVLGATNVWSDNRQDPSNIR